MYRDNGKESGDYYLGFRASENSGKEPSTLNPTDLLPLRVVALVASACESKRYSGLGASKTNVKKLNSCNCNIGEMLFIPVRTTLLFLNLSVIHRAPDYPQAIVFISELIRRISGCRHAGAKHSC